ncbi:hypothetical protein MPSEU_001106900 [Mayamaea pseudoterrestris]|nr:hypothetical protein MPSEU_001106900 [Mayamaea pseudoterrestris]
MTATLADHKNPSQAKQQVSHFSTKTLAMSAAENDQGCLSKRKKLPGWWGEASDEINDLMRAFSKNNSPLWPEDDRYAITYNQLVLMTLQTDIRDRFVETLKAFAVESITIYDRYQYEEYYNFVPPPDNDILMTASIVASCFTSVLSVKLIEYALEYGQAPRRAVTNVFWTLLIGCSSLKKLQFSLSDHNLQVVGEGYEQTKLALELAGELPPRLDEITIFNIDDEEGLHRLLNPVPTLWYLTKISITVRDALTNEDGDDYVPAFAVDSCATLLRGILSKPVLQQVRLENFQWDTEVFTRAFERSNKATGLELYADSWRFPVELAGTMARALATGPFRALTYVCSRREQCHSIAFFEELSRCLCIEGCSMLKELTMELQNCSAPPTEVLTALLRHAKPWQVQMLSLKVSDEQWTEDFVTVLCHYVHANTSLRKLAIAKGAGGWGPEWSSWGWEWSSSLCDAPSSLLKAICNGSGSLDEVDFRGIFHSEWIDKFDTGVALNLNRLKRVHGPLFQQAEQVDPGPCRRLLLVRAVARVDQQTRFALLRENYANCLASLLEEMQSRKRPHSAI